MTYIAQEDGRVRAVVDLMTDAVLSAYTEGYAMGSHSPDTPDRIHVAQQTQANAQNAIYELAQQLHAEAVA